MSHEILGICELLDCVLEVCLMEGGKFVFFFLILQLGSMLYLFYLSKR